MAIVTSYSTLLTAVSDYLARSDLSTFTPNFVQNFEERFYRDSENWASWMESALSVSISSNVAAVPSDYLDLRIAYISGYQPLKRVTLEQLYSRYPRGAGTSGIAKFIARNATNFEFGPEGVSGTLAGTYLAKPTVLRSYTTGGADAAAHFLIVNAPDLLIYGALLEAEPFLKNDARLVTWKSAYDWALDSYRKRFVAEDYSGSAPFTVAV
jgi:hypothetical protein